MLNLVVLALVLPAVLSRVAFDFNNQGLYEGITIEDLKEIHELNALTKKLEESPESFQRPLQSTITISEKDVSFFITNTNLAQKQEVLLAEANKITSLSSFRTDLKTIFLIHGWHNDIDCNLVKRVGQAYLKVANVNLVIVNWAGLASQLYLEAYSAVPQVGAYAGQFISNISATYNYPLDWISLVGHSLGAHIGGYAGKTTKGLVHSITGLDPAGPLYLQSNQNDRLSENDARYVQSIHTDSSLLGVNFDVGHADYWPNGGRSQPGCGMDLDGVCAHGRSYDYFAESLTSDRFVARLCDSYSVYTNGACKTKKAVVMGGPEVNTTIYGTYYLQTNSTSPYALGNVDL